jgi:hypothetical protein
MGSKPFTRPTPEKMFYSKHSKRENRRNTLLKNFNIPFKILQAFFSSLGRRLDLFSYP